MIQLFLAVLSLTALWLMTSSQPKRRWLGACFGLCSQPFWLYATWTADQAGMFLLAVVYTGRYIYVIYRDFP